jgi:hypothetical protein
MTVLTKPSDDLLDGHDGRLPSSLEEIPEAIRQGEEDIKAGRLIPMKESLARLEAVIGRVSLQTKEV